MIRVVVTPQTTENFYAMLAKKEPHLQTFYRQGRKKRGEQKWKHTTYQGWVNLQEALGGVLVASVQAKNSDEEWKILKALIGLLDRHFREQVSNINISYVLND